MLLEILGRVPCVLVTNYQSFAANLSPIEDPPILILICKLNSLMWIEGRTTACLYLRTDCLEHVKVVLKENRTFRMRNGSPVLVFADSDKLEESD